MRRLEALYEGTRSRVTSFLRGAGPDLDEVGARAVPACPGWTVKDVVSHLAGLSADVVAGNVLGAASEPWTAAQVEARRGHALEEVLAEWDAGGPRLAALADDLPVPYGPQAVADAGLHEHDIRAALGDRGARCSLAVTASLEFLMAHVVEPGAAERGLRPLEVVAGPRRWVVGAPGEPEGALAAEPFDLARAFSGRRSARQVRALAWTVTPDPYLPLFDLPPFTLRQTDLAE